MARIVIRGLENEVKVRLERRAKRHGRSMEEEIREILRNAVSSPERPVAGLGSRIAARIAAFGLPAEPPELHGRAAVPGDAFGTRSRRR